jgi:hypothetical protein
MSNKYFVHFSYQEKAVPWDPGQQELNELSTYFTTIFRSIEQALSDAGLTFYLTWKLDHLPSTGRDVVAVVMADEWAQMPSYASDVLCTFKCYGSQMQMDASIGDLTNASGWATLARDLRVGAARLPGWLRYQVRMRGALGTPSYRPVYPLPLGYGNQKALAIQPINERTTDVFFAGSVRHAEGVRTGLRRWIRSPKELSRTAMLCQLDATASKHALAVDLKLNNRFVLNAIGYGLARPGEVYSAAEYSQRLMNSKVCLAPRGTSLETYRYYEGLRYGCVVITEPQPPHWFYRDAPAITVRDWRELQDLIPYLLAHPDVLEKKHEDARAWWNTVVSEEAVASYMVDCIRAQQKIQTTTSTAV